MWRVPSLGLKMFKILPVLLSASCVFAQTINKQSNVRHRSLINTPILDEKSISARNLCCITLFLPIFATLFCLIWSVLFDFEKSTATHCKVKNYLPSISSAIGGFTPQRYVWRICIALHSAPRMLVASSYYNFHSDVHVGPKNNLYQLLVKLCITLHVIENLALVFLTFISSTENHAVHENSFIVFMACSQVYMLFTCFVMKWGRTYGGRNCTKQERRSFKYKVALFIFNLSAFLTAVYLFYQHNWYCEPGVYSLFALFEYLTVFSNIAFHGTAIQDFSGYSLIMVPPDNKSA